MEDHIWGMIRSGPTFQAMASTLVFFEDAGAALFGRPGKDGGQDIRSGDRTLVYQAKHHKDASPAMAIADAKNEATKIAAYKKPGHANFELWQNVTKWRLVTNAAFNPHDLERWNQEVVPEFKKLGLVADYWEKANLEALLAKHPEVDRAFSQGQNRAFLTLPEIRERLSESEPFLPEGAVTKFVGRTEELASVRSFLDSDKLFLVIHGAGGTGKTRLLVAAGESIAEDGARQVLWANAASMEASGNWFASIHVERPTLVLLDEENLSEDTNLLRQMTEQLGGGRASMWKIVIAVRSTRDPILKALQAPGMENHVEWLPLLPMDLESAEEMCRNLLDADEFKSQSEPWRHTTAKQLATLFDRHPIWITLAVHLLERDHNLLKTIVDANGLASRYVKEIIELEPEFPPEQVQALLRWVALFGVVSRDNEALIDRIAANAKIPDRALVLRLMFRLVERRALRRRGANDRLHEIKPDVIRDHLLQKWLTVDIGDKTSLQPSGDAKGLVTQVLSEIANPTYIDRYAKAILAALGRTEILMELAEKPVPLLDPFYQELKARLPTMKASEMLLLPDALSEIADVRPSDTVEISALLRTANAATENVEGLIRARQVGQDDITQSLAWMVFHAATGARNREVRSQVLKELGALAEAEAEIEIKTSKGPRNDGKRAAGLIGRVLEGGPQFWSAFGDETFDHVAFVMGLSMLEVLRKEAPSAPKAAVAKVLLEAVTSLERSQTWSEDFKIHITRYILHKDHPAKKYRDDLVARIKEILASDETPLSSRLLLWNTLSEVHRDAGSSCRMATEEYRKELRQEILDHLLWAKPILESRKGQLEELKTARHLWSWHVRFDTEEEFKNAAAALEAIYDSNSLAGEFAPLVDHNVEWSETEKRLDQKAAHLAESQDFKDIVAFIDRAKQFFGDNVHEAFHIAYRVGAFAPTSHAVRDFIDHSFRDGESLEHADFAALAATTWVDSLRRSGKSGEANALVGRLLNLADSNEKKVLFVQRMYGNPPLASQKNGISAAEHERLRSLQGMFLEAGKARAFIRALGWTFGHDWEGFKVVVENTLDALEREELLMAVVNLVDALFWGVRNGQAEIPEDFAVWTLDQVLRVPDTDELRDHCHWHLEEILKKTGKPSVVWLSEKLKSRVQMESEAGGSGFQAVSGHPRLSQYVAQLIPQEVGKEEIVKAVESLIDLAVENAAAAFYMPQYLTDIDPEGILVPKQVAKRIEDEKDLEHIRQLAKMGSGYAIGTPSWRNAVAPAVKVAHELESQQRQSLYFAFANPGPTTWSGTPGQVPELFINNVERAKKRLEEEQDPVFKPYWEWTLTYAEAQLRQQVEYAKEK